MQNGNRRIKKEFMVWVSNVERRSWVKKKVVNIHFETFFKVSFCFHFDSEFYILDIKLHVVFHLLFTVFIKMINFLL